MNIIRYDNHSTEKTIDKTSANSPRKDLVIKNYLIIGTGKLARHLVNYFSLKKINFIQISYKENYPKFIFSNTQPASILENIETVLYAISDSAIKSVHQKLTSTVNAKKFIHFSGALSLEEIYCAHPLMSFSDKLYDFDFYEKIHFVISPPQLNHQINHRENSQAYPQGSIKVSDDNSKSMDLTLKFLFPELENSYTLLSNKDKEMYHALCVLGGNFPVILWTKMSSELSKLKIPEEVQFSFLKTTLGNFQELKEMALTGPLARKDLFTINKNIASLKEDPFLDVYKAFVKVKGIQL